MKSLILAVSLISLNCWAGPHITEGPRMDNSDSAYDQMYEDGAMDADPISENPYKSPNEPTCPAGTTLLKLPNGTFKCVPRYR